MGESPKEEKGKAKKWATVLRKRGEGTELRRIVRKGKQLEWDFTKENEMIGSSETKQNKTKKKQHKMERRKSLKMYTPMSIKVASEKNDAWSTFHSPRCIIISLET